MCIRSKYLMIRMGLTLIYKNAIQVIKVFFKRPFQFYKNAVY